MEHYHWLLPYDLHTSLGALVVYCVHFECPYQVCYRFEHVQNIEPFLAFLTMRLSNPRVTFSTIIRIMCSGTCTSVEKLTLQKVGVNPVECAPLDNPVGGVSATTPGGSSAGVHRPIYRSTD